MTAAITFNTDEFLQQVIIPGFKPLVNQNIYSTIYDTVGKVIITTNKVAKNFGFEDWHEMIGLNYRELLPWMIPIAKRPLSDPQLVEQGIAILKKIGQMQQVTIKLKKSTNLIIISPFQKVFSPFVFLQYAPLFDPHGEIIAIQGTSTNYQMFGFGDYFKLISFKKGSIKEKLFHDQEIKKLNLTERQHEILFLVSHEVSQRTIEQILGIKRGNIAKTISTALCPKFGIIGSNSKQLIAKARAINIHKFVPLSLCKPMVILMDEEVKIKYQEMFPEE